MKMKKYRVNESEVFNLQSMYEHLKCDEIYMNENIDDYSEKDFTALYERIKEVENLMDKAYCVGALVTWPELKRIREIKAERQLIRYANCLAMGTPENEAAIAFDL